ncbi:MAG TPA: glycosyltransferase [Candidatus Baltobacteraceae bacterium]|jgi:glycosyltransferase involved in cell wall biosynthesis|nr:glycosyltransferase [Candidatus Baltobacteraceae bacterium]
MRVIHVITRLIIGGAQENTAATVLGLRKTPGLEVSLIAGPTSGPEGSLQSVFQNDAGLLTIVPSLVRPIHPVLDAIALMRLTGIFRRTCPDIVHTHSGKAGFLGRLAARRASVPVIVHTIHGPSFGAFQGALANAVFLAAERRAGAITTHFVSVADAMTRQYVAAGIGHPEKYTRVFSGFDLAPFLNARNDPQMRSSLGIAPDDFVIGKIARLFKLKGHDDLIDAAPEVLKRRPQTKFLLVGDGVLRHKLEGRVRQMGLERSFIFAGLVPPSEIPRYVGIMDVVVHLSRREGLARALPQGLAARRPVVACECDGAAEVCISDETGFLVRPGDTELLAARLAQLAQSEALRDRLGARGQELVRRHFAVETMVEDIYNLYRKLAAPKDG